MATDPGIHEEAAPSWVRHIVVPADGSPASLQGLTLAADVARRTGARVTVVHVRHLPAGSNLSGGTEGAALVETLNEMEADVRAAAHEVLDKAGVRWDLIVRSGSPGEQVLVAVKELGANLVIVGSKRHSSVHNVLLGSTSVFLASHSPVPVLVARPEPGEEPAS
jgi:nucleotide-binding universal stress UspA family protein